MGLKAMICPQCNGSIAVDEDKQTLKCEYCGTPFLTEDVINYNINKTIIDIDHIDNLIVHDSKSVENQLESARASLFKLQDYKKSFEAFKNISEIAAGDYRGWLGMSISASAEYIQSVDFDIKDNNGIKNRINEIKEIRKYIEHTSKVSGPSVNRELNTIKNELDESLTEIQPLEELRNYTEISSDLYSNKYNLEKKKEEVKEFNKENNNKMGKFFSITFVITLILALLSFTEAVFFIVSTIVCGVIMIFGMVILGLLRKKASESLLSEQNKLEQTGEALKQELAVRSDKSAFDKINGLIKQVSKLPESLFDMD